MKIVIGLGNPGRKYERTRHNAGFQALDELGRELEAAVTQEKHHCLIGRTRFDGDEAVLAKPQTYMNESGRAAAALLRSAYVAPGDLIVLHDELDLPLGSVRIKVGGGHGGHNGLRSLVEHLGSAEFVRVRIGIGRPEPGIDPAEYVLSPFTADERPAAGEAAKRAAEAVLHIVRDGPEKAMNEFNRQ